MALSCALDAAGAIAGALPRARIMVLSDQPSVGDYLVAVQLYSVPSTVLPDTDQSRSTGPPLPGQAMSKLRHRHQQKHRGCINMSLCAA